MKQKMKIRKMKISDIPIIFPIGKKTKEFNVDSNFEGFWSKKQLKNWIKSKNDVLLIAEENKKILGFVMFSIHTPTKKAIFENIWVSLKNRGKGISSILIKEAIKILKAKNINYICSLVKEDAEASIKFHKKNNFHKGYKFIWFHKKI